MTQREFTFISDQITEELERIEREETAVLAVAERGIAAVREALDRMRQAIVATPFTTETDEIHFFKVDKPRLASRLVYFMKMYRIERGLPVGSQELQLKYLNNELGEIDLFYVRYQEFLNYYRGGSTVLDQHYFVRGRQDLHFLMDTEWIYADPDFSTGYDLLVAKLLANQDLVGYVNERIARISAGQGETVGGKERAESAIAGSRSGFAQTPLKGAEIYVLLKSLIDAQGVINHTYKSFFELVVPGIANMQQKAFVANSLLKYSDKVDPESRENAKRLLNRMIRNIDTY